MDWPRSKSVNFDEAWYLATYSDVADAVRAGACASGWDHYVQFGLREGRLGSPQLPATLGQVTTKFDPLETSPLTSGIFNSDSPLPSFSQNGDRATEIDPAVTIVHDAGGAEVCDVKRLRSLEEENAKLKKLLAEAILDNAMLKDLAGKTW
jgi:putative transposase